MRTYKNYDVSESNLQPFLATMSDLQCEIKASSLAQEGRWRLLVFVDSSDESILDKQIQSFNSSVNHAEEYEKRVLTDVASQ